ncbi:HAD family phosphatase [Vibrio sp. S4M6]|uniref:HAD family hydrolase n=1 Tax=Vibrio sinus TaxID=2946865 RepID=UPI00202A00A8|nr:HAD family phosphatase [Vibrio sinus]MCL9783711.1 HAD family phosphatase [Vibrio sinus]
MAKYEIKNVVFDVGNVLVRWSPYEIVRLTFGEDVEATDMAKRIFLSDIWSSLNKGEMTETQAISRYEERLGLKKETLEVLFYYIKESLIPIYGMYELLCKLKESGYKIFALTDNVVEIVDFLQDRYEFWQKFDGAIVSAEVGCLKPSAEIYRKLLETYQLDGKETVFMDDVLANVKGAQDAGIHAIHFKNLFQCRQELADLSVDI